VERKSGQALGLVPYTLRWERRVGVRSLKGLNLHNIGAAGEGMGVGGAEKGEETKNNSTNGKI